MAKLECQACHETITGWGALSEIPSTGADYVICPRCGEWNQVTGSGSDLRTVRVIAPDERPSEED